MLKPMRISLCVTAFSLTGLLGCGSGEPAAQPAAKTSSDATYVVQEEPTGAVGVGEARKSTKNEDEVVITGRIGGSHKPFVTGLAAFTIVDEKVPYCAPDEGCPAPWDYCCTQNDVKDNIAQIKLVDASGKVVNGDAKELLGVKELSLVTIHGKTQRDDAGNLVVLADKIFIKEITPSEYATAPGE